MYVGLLLALAYCCCQNIDISKVMVDRPGCTTAYWYGVFSCLTTTTTLISSSKYVFAFITTTSVVANHQ